MASTGPTTSSASASNPPPQSASEAQREANFHCPDELSKFGVELKKLDLSPTTITHRMGTPCFFGPLSETELKRIYQIHHPKWDSIPSVDSSLQWGHIAPSMELELMIEDHFREEFPEELRESEDLFSLDRYSIFKDSDLEGLSVSFPRLYRAQASHGSGGYEWRLMSFNFSQKAEYPHGIISLIQNPRADDVGEKLTRGELVILSVMVARSMARNNMTSHKKFPVLLFSYFTRKVRIIQAYLDGKLQIAVSPWIDFTEFKEQNAELVVRWILSTPCGDTRTEPQPVANPVQLRKPVERKVKRSRGKN
ncbi:hypothetical protein FQN57_004117 [Myotisia sp. PD_48]|nr:hypothetical protein FQN57_004117 [Myotisia sp. PD_48]